MALVSVNDVLAHAYRCGYAVGAFNVVGLEFLNGILEVAEKTRSPVIISIAEVHFKYVNMEEIAPAIRHMAQEASVPVVLHLDHGESVETVVRAIRSGFSSVMFDGSKLPFEENLEKTALVSKIAHAVNVSVEAELGRVVGAEGGRATEVPREEYFTDPDQAKDFVQRTEIDALAISIGNAHGLYKGTPKLDFDRLIAIRDKVNMPLVLHGGSGISDEDFRKAARLGISKINFFTEMSRQATERVKKALAEDPSIIGLQDLLLEAKKAISTVVEKQMRVFGSVGVCSERNDLCPECLACPVGTGSPERSTGDHGELIGRITEEVIRVLRNR